MQCPSCKGREYHFLLVDGDMLHEAVKIPCERCKGTGEVSEAKILPMVPKTQA